MIRSKILSFKVISFILRFYNDYICIKDLIILVFLANWICSLSRVHCKYNAHIKSYNYSHRCIARRIGRPGYDTLRSRRKILSMLNVISNYVISNGSEEIGRRINKH